MADRWCIKVREKGKRAWYFVTPSGGMNRLRVHAAQWNGKDKAESSAAYAAGNNERYEFKVVES